MHQPLDFTDVPVAGFGIVFAFFYVGGWVLFGLTALIAKIINKPLAKKIHMVAIIILAVATVTLIGGSVAVTSNADAEAKRIGAVEIADYLNDEFGITVSNSQAIDLYNLRSKGDYDLYYYTPVEHKGETIEVGFRMNADGTYTLVQRTVEAVE